MLKEGDLIEIPLTDGRVAVGWLLLISKRFTNTVGFIVFGIRGECRIETANSPLNFLGPFYTHIDNLRDSGVKAVDFVPISESGRDLTKRRVAGGVYVGDEYIGSVQELALGDLKPMLFMGMPLIQKEIEEAFEPRAT
jgi:hypothetical protein